MATSSVQSDVSPETNTSSLITQNMINEEERLQEDTEKNNNVSSLLQKHEFSGMVVSQRYARLQHLLDKSGIYSKILLNRMKDQREENKKKLMMKKHTKRRRKGKKEKENNVHDGVKADSDTTTNELTPMKTRSGGRGRKRKAACNESYQLSDFMDDSGKLRKRPRHEGTKTNPTIPKRSTEPDKERTKQEENREAENDEERFFEGKPIPIGQPRLVTGGIMRPYQLEGTEWLKVLYENGVNGILADEMGLGKTIQCIALIAHLVEMGVKGPYLVVAPLSTVPNWISEFKRFTPEIPVVLYHGSISERDSLRRKAFSSRRMSLNTVLPVFVTSYEIVMNDHKYLAHKEWKLLIVDEGHRIKNLNCLLIKMLKTYNAGNRLLLTGTPLQNNLTELWSLLNFILPDIFDDLNNFQSWFDFSSIVKNAEGSTSEIIAKEKEDHVLSTLHEILSPFLLRRLKCDVELKIPPKREIVVYAPLTPLQEKYYTGILNKTIEQLLDTQKNDTLHTWGMVRETDEKENNIDGARPVRKRTQLTRFINDEEFDDMLRHGVEEEEMKLFGLSSSSERNKLPNCSVSSVKMTCVWVMLRKCCNHPYLVSFPMLPNGEFKVDEELISSCGKMLVLDQMLNALIPAGHKVLIFSQMTSLLDLLEDFMDLRGLRYARLDGSTKFDDRVTEMQRFKESPDCNIFLLSTRAGGLGINLTAADTVIIYDSDWNPQSDLQAQDRCHRIGQTKPVIVYRFVTSNTIDQNIVQRAAAKRRLEKMVIHKDKFKGYSKGTSSSLSLDDLVDLLKSVDHDKVFDSQQVLSSEVLEALLDRNFASSKVKEITEDVKHQEFFTVLDEQEGNENTLGGVNSGNNTVGGGVNSGNNTVGGVSNDNNTVGGVNNGNNTVGGVNNDNDTVGGVNGDDNTVGGINSDDNTVGGVNGSDNTVGGVNGDDNTLGGVNGDDNTLGGVNGDDNTLGGVNGDDNTLGGVNGDDNTLGGVNCDDNMLGKVNSGNNTLGGVNSDNIMLGGVNGDHNKLDGVEINTSNGINTGNTLDGVERDNITLGGVESSETDMLEDMTRNTNTSLDEVNH